MIIEVVDKSIKVPESISVIIDDSCNHEGATYEEVDRMEFDNDSKNYAPTGSETVLLCKCGAWLMETDEGGEWIA